MEENKQIVKEDSTDIGYKVIAGTLMLIGIVATGNTIISGGKKFIKMIGNKINKKEPKENSEEEE